MSDKWVPRTSRPVIMGSRYMVSTGHYLASLAATRILDAGGNAVDAGVAAGLCLNVVQPDLTNIGGVAPICLYQADTGRVATISGLGHWPAGTDLDYFTRTGHIPVGLPRSVVPAAMGAWLTALERFGTMSLRAVAAPAVELAAEGFPVHAVMHDTMSEPKAVANLRRWPGNASVFLDAHGDPLPVGARCVQTDLAATLTRLGDADATGTTREAGIAAARDRFYRGDIAAELVRFSREGGGWLSEQDLAGFEPEVEDALSVDYRGARVYGCGPWCQGPVVLQTLGILAGYDLAALPLGGTDYYHVILEALKAAFADRDRYYGDPRFVPVPVEGLLSPEYAATRRAGIDLGAASPGMPAPGDAWAFNGTPEPEPSQWRFPTPAGGPSQPDTSYLCVVDSAGNAFSATPSDGVTGTPIVPGLGFIISSRGVQSWIDQRHPASIRPGKRPRLTPNPGLVVKPGEFVMPYGTPGADVQPQAMVQFLVAHLDHGLDPQAAVEVPRAATYSYPGTHDPHPYHAGLVRLEGRAGREVAAGLVAKGHRVESWPELTGVAGSVGAIRAEVDGRGYFGAADPRRVAYALGW
ncbi:hypothetical protein BLA60_08805 [Actinophytocola xinjiangensis]|uniref:Gamma-glutamyltranspeptidase/glutathione hydrolase n=1 Tax=Actinophytocola xinjiangensis TaxID=485602 RepID=A0A7Z0WP41_9PSEU|nr:gamma-glutamyltransferase family protein [Actinophytocola xinjiangensis]OLF12108.1 hypothetical protein BLA60_08805 [Actinophytocola xinjiangensis]